MSADLPSGAGQLPIGTCGNALPNLVLGVLCNLGFITSLGKFLQRVTNLTQRRFLSGFEKRFATGKLRFYLV